MKWFQVEKVKNPSKEEPEDEPVLTIHGDIMDAADIPLYKMLNYGSKIYVYDRHDYFLARQYAHDRHTNTTLLYAEYRLTLTDKAQRKVNDLLNEPFGCTVGNLYEVIGDGEDAQHYKVGYECISTHRVYIPVKDPRRLDPIRLIRAEWYIGVSVDVDRLSVSRLSQTTIPFNCGPLRPLWERVVECWIKKFDYLRELRSKGIIRVRDALLQYKFLDDNIVVPMHITW